MLLAVVLSGSFPPRALHVWPGAPWLSRGKLWRTLVQDILQAKCHSRCPNNSVKALKTNQY